MKNAELIYVEVLNETEHFFVFAVKNSDKQLCGLELILNLALPVEVQDIKIRKTITKVEAART